MKEFIYKEVLYNIVIVLRCNCIIYCIIYNY